jgi:hypothetical protein
MKVINRAKAIKTLFWCADQRGLSNDSLHTAVDAVMIKDDTHISCMSADELKLALLKIFNWKTFVTEDKLVWKIRKLCENSEISWKAVETLVKSRFGKANKIISIYHLTHKQQWMLHEVVKGIIEKNEECINGETK